MYIATRGLYNVKPPTVFVPPCIKDDVEELLQVHRRMSQIELNVELVALDLGMNSSSPFIFLVCFLFLCSLCRIFQGRHEIRNDLVARPFQTYHAIPNQVLLLVSSKLL
jgi:ribonuclease Z